MNIIPILSHRLVTVGWPGKRVLRPCNINVIPDKELIRVKKFIRVTRRANLGDRISRWCRGDKFNINTYLNMPRTRHQWLVEEEKRRDCVVNHGKEFHPPSVVQHSSAVFIGGYWLMAKSNPRKLNKGHGCRV